jgi:ectoine hydroxylase-related dioxygenase (phytanoyl-CoA dioxygenase family)
MLQSISLNPIVLDTLRMLYKNEPYPFQTITFNYGSNQPLHSDLIHFDSLPHRWLSAVWVALEDMTDQNGSLVYVPKSHKLPIFDFYDLKIKVPEYGKQFDSYAEYEVFIQELVESSELEVKPLHCKKGQALIWAANLIHGGDIIRNPDSSRYSHVTHYYYDNCDVYFSPMFSEAWKGKFAEKNISEKNIREHKF